MGGCCNKEVHSEEEEPYGPVGKRKCRDVLFLLLFIAFWVGMVAVAIKAVDEGEPRR
jgi:choline transporter-like protein 2/4/5